MRIFLQVILTAVVLSVFINRCAKERAMEMMDGEEEEQNQDDVQMYKKNEEEWLLQTPLDDELGNKYFNPQENLYLKIVRVVAISLFLQNVNMVIERSV